MMKVILRILPLLSLCLLLASCSTTKYVGQGEYLVEKVVIDSDNKDYKSADLKSYLRQQANFKTFGLVRWPLYVYNWSGRDENRWLSKQLRRIGEPPVLLDTLLVEQSVDELERFFINKGYPHVDVIAEVDTSRNKKAVVTYHIESNEPFLIRDYSMELSDPTIDSIAHLKPPVRSRFAGWFRSTSDDYTPLVKEGSLFDRDVLDRERQRITTLLRRRGYYAFNRDNLGYLADSTVQKNMVDVDMILKPYRKIMSDGSIEERPHSQYYIKDITILTDYDPLRTDGITFTPTDSVQLDNLKIIYGQSGKSIRPGVIRRNTYIIPGRRFNERSLEQTYSSLSSLHALRNVNIRFNEIEEGDSMKLSATVLTSMAKVHGFGVDVEGTNSAGNFGFASSMNYQHRNLFKGSEMLSVRLRGAFESLSGDEDDKLQGFRSYWELGGDASLNIPGFVFPFLTENFRRRLRATTEFRVSYNRQTRPEYKRSILSGGWSYIWQDRTNSLARHTFKLLDIDYLFLPYMEDSFKLSLPETTRLYNYNDQFIVGSGYSYSFNSYNPQNRQRNTHSFRIAVEMAGNVLYGLSKLTNAKKNQQGSYNLFGTEYSQFIKTDFDFSKGIVIDERNRFAYHFGVGIAVPYANSKRLPFERRYFSGGANSVRGWSVRTLGPGSMSRDSIFIYSSPDSGIASDTIVPSFATRVGDIRFDANIEYRTRLFWKFELAAYIDAGNIWTIRSYDDQPKGNFDFGRFYKEIAFSYGLGLRLDFDFFLVRLDTGFKAYDPQQRGSRKWAITRPNFKTNDNFAIHFAVGYPF